MSRRKLRDFGDGRTICGVKRTIHGQATCTRITGHQGDHICQWANSSSWSIEWAASE